MLNLPFDFIRYILFTLYSINSLTIGYECISRLISIKCYLVYLKINMAVNFGIAAVKIILENKLYKKLEIRILLSYAYDRNVYKLMINC